MEPLDRYLETFLSQKPENLFILVWRAKDKRSFWMTDTARIPAIVARSEESDLYIGMGLSPHDYGSTARCKEADIAGIMGLWIDLDYGTIGHKKTNNPPTWAECEALLSTIELAPTMIVDSGGGMHAYWMFDRPWLFYHDEDHAAAKALETSLVKALQNAAHRHGWDVDGVQDLSRILRLPGTYNHKHEPPIMADLRLCEPDRRYTIEELRAAIPIIQQAKSSSKNIRSSTSDHSDQFTFDPNANPPVEKLEALLDNPKFKKTWKRQRGEDLPDRTASGYCQSLAVFGIQAGWTDQEVINLLIAWRRMHNEEAKRDSWYLSEVQKAKEKCEGDRALDDILGDYESGGDKDQLIHLLNSIFHITIIRMVRFKIDPPRYHLITDKGEINLGDVSHVTGQKAFRDHVASAAKHYIPRFKSFHWEKIVPVLIDAFEDEELPEATTTGMITSWLEQYLEKQAICEDKNDTTASRSPFLDKGDIYFYLPDFEKWLPLHLNVNKDTTELAPMLRIAGCDSERVHMTHNDKRTTRSCWKVPEKIALSITRGGQHEF